MPDAPENTPDPTAALGFNGQRFLALVERMEAFLDKAGGADPDPADFAPVEAMRELLGERNTALAAMRARAAEKRVGEALAAGYITPGMRPWALALCREKPDSFETFLAAGAPAYAHFLRPAGPIVAPTAHAAAFASPEAEAICRQLGLDPEALRK